MQGPFLCIAGVRTTRTCTSKYFRDQENASQRLPRHQLGLPGVAEKSRGRGYNRAEEKMKLRDSLRRVDPPSLLWWLALVVDEADSFGSRRSSSSATARTVGSRSGRHRCGGGTWRRGMREIVTKRSPFRIYLAKHDGFETPSVGSATADGAGFFFFNREAINVNGGQMT